MTPQDELQHSARKHRDFDAQADRFDDRTGLGPDVAARVASAVLTQINPPPGGALLEIGAGTGEIGQHFARSKCHYVALDRSWEMLHRFPASARSAPNAIRLVADGDRPWPIADASIDAVFSSRALHLLDPDSTMTQLRRVCRPAARLCLGRVRRDPDGVNERLRDAMHRALVHHGCTPKPGRERNRQFIDSVAAHSTGQFETTEAAQWAVRRIPARIIDEWRKHDALGGIPVSNVLRSRVLDNVTNWAKGAFGNLDVAQESRETYILQSIRLD